jgi:c-di-GMP-binding flagellar brake protein YcgR
MGEDSSSLGGRMRTINTKQLSHSKAKREFVAEASDIGFGGIGSVVNQALKVQSQKTGEIVEFQFTTCERTNDEDNEIISWVYSITRASATKVPAMAGYKLHILND